MLLVEREAVKPSLDESWNAVGIYLLIGSGISDGSALSVYVGKAQGLRSRVRSGHATNDWRDVC
jgi:excinuclease UvrABC nuclease subunit